MEREDSCAGALAAIALVEVVMQLPATNVAVALRTEAAASRRAIPDAACPETSVTVVGMPFHWHGSRYPWPDTCTQSEYLPAGRPWNWNAPSPPDLVFLANGGVADGSAITNAAGMGF